MSRPALIQAGGVFVPGELCEPLWRLLRDDLTRRGRDGGGRLRPGVTELLDALRGGWQQHLTTNVRANGHAPRTSADLEPSCEKSCSTAQLADRLGVTDRHARRLAKAEGIAPHARNRWALDDVDALTARRR